MRIKIYGHVESFRLSAGLITHHDYIQSAATRGPKLSSRVKSERKDVLTVSTRFHPCTKDEFPRLKDLLQERFPEQRNFTNPFIESEKQGLKEGRYQGYIRGWDVLDFEKNVVTQSRWGIKEDQTKCRLTVCYREGVLGIAVRHYTGEKQTVAKLEATKSMYRD